MYPAQMIDRLVGNTLRDVGLRPMRRETAADMVASYLAFKKAMYPPYQHVLHQAFLDRYLIEVARYVETGGQEGIGRLIVEMPPRHGKTINISKLFPAWFEGRNPDRRLINTSYSAKLANRNSRAVRNYIRDKRYGRFFPTIKLSRDTASLAEWDIENREGGMISAGVGGGVTGHGAHILNVDDPIKSRLEAESPTYRENLIDWWGDVYTRLEEPGGAAIVTHTRWHQADLIGHLTNPDMAVDDFVVIRLPAIAEENDLLGRQPGEALWPERYPLAKLEKRRETLGEYRFAAEYQQKPIARSGQLFDPLLIEIIDEAPECKAWARFYDLAATAKSRADYTAGLKMGITEDEYIILADMFRGQMTPTDVHEGIVQNAQIDGRHVPIRLEAEKQGIVQLDYLLDDERLRGYTIDAMPPVGDKYTRAQPFASRVKNRRVKMVRGTWNRAYLEELATFPSGANDDQVDASSGAYEMLTPSGSLWGEVW